MKSLPYIIKPEDSIVRQNCIAEINGLNIFKTWEVIIDEVRRRRSLPQNKLYWRYLGIVKDSTGHITEDLHDFFKMDILGFRDITFKGHTVSVPKSTTQLTTMQFSNYIDEIKARVGAYGIILPPAGHWGY